MTAETTNTVRTEAARERFIADFLLEHRADAKAGARKNDFAGEKLRRDLGAVLDLITDARDAVAWHQGEGEWPGDWDEIKLVAAMTAIEGLVDASRSRVVNEYGDN